MCSGILKSFIMSAAFSGLRHKCFIFGSFFSVCLFCFLLCAVRRTRMNVSPAVHQCCMSSRTTGAFASSFVVCSLDSKSRFDLRQLSVCISMFSCLCDRSNYLQVFCINVLLPPARHCVCLSILKLPIGR